MEPILKWAGGKRNLLPVINEVIDESGFDSETGRYFEPFVGGGALCFNREFPSACINDLNEELVNVYKQIKKNPIGLIQILEIHAANHSKEYYQKIRGLDRVSDYKNLDNLERAARIIYLNRTCYNGLYRVNKSGEFNVPMGNYKKPEIVMKDRIMALSKYLRKNKVTISNKDFSNAVEKAKAGDLIYFDPPYDYDNEGFSTYTADGFGYEQLKRLKEISDKLVEKDCIVIVSNNETKNVLQLFEKDDRYVIRKVKASRFISCDGKKREKASEVIIYGRK